MPHILSLVLAKYNANIRAIFDTEAVPEGTLKPRGFTDLGGARTSPLNMRREILARRGSNNILFCFHVGWILPAVELVLPSSRVVNLCTKESFQRFCRDLAEGRPEWKDVLIEHLAISYDPHWQVVLMREHMELYRIGEGDIFAEVVYFAGLWRLLGPRILERRRNGMVHKIKMMVPVITGIGLEPEESALVEKDVSLIDRPGLMPIKEFARHDFEALQMVDNDPTVSPTRNNWLPSLFKKVLAMIQTYGSKLLPAPFYRSDFGNHEYQRPLATQIATAA